MKMLIAISLLSLVACMQPSSSENTVQATITPLSSQPDLASGSVSRVDIDDSTVTEPPPEDIAFLDRNIKITATLQEKNECNLYVRYLLVKNLTKNIDSIKRCAEIITEKTYGGMYNLNCGAIKKRCAIYLYTSKANYDKQKNFTAYMRNMNRPMSKIFNAENL